MGWVRGRNLSDADDLAVKALALDSYAARAGTALGCCYANSREYEAELIAKRRAAGVYGPARRPLRARGALLAAALVLTFLIALFLR
jgi:hypothetical protein